MAYYDETLFTYEELKEEIVRQIRPEQVDSHASKDLFDIRMKIEQLENEMIQKAESVIRANGDYMADNFHTTRNGRICVPVKKEYRNKVQGSVIDKSSTGNTLFVEPEGVSRLSEKLQLLKIDEENSRFVNILSDQVEHLYDVEFMYERVKKHYPSNNFPTREGFRMSLETVTPYLLTKMTRQPSLSLVDSVILNILNQLFHFNYRIRYPQTSDEKLLQKFLESIISAGYKLSQASESIIVEEFQKRLREDIQIYQEDIDEDKKVPLYYKVGVKLIQSDIVRYKDYYKKNIKLFITGKQSESKDEYL